MKFQVNFRQAWVLMKLGVKVYHGTNLATYTAHPETPIVFDGIHTKISQPLLESSFWALDIDDLEGVRTKHMTARQFQIMFLLSLGLSQVKIAEILFVQPSAIRSTIDKVRIKVGGHTLIEMINRLAILGEL